MRYLRFCLIGFVLFLVLGTGIVALVTEKTWKVERSVVAAVPPARVAEFAQDLKRWPSFLPSEAQYSFGATSVGPGARLTMESAQGRADVELTRFDPERGLEYSVRFPRDEAVLPCRIDWTAEGAGTRITWHESGAVGWNPIPRLLRGVIEAGRGEVVESSLARLRAALAAPPRAVPGG